MKRPMIKYDLYVNIKGIWNFVLTVFDKRHADFFYTAYRSTYGRANVKMYRIHLDGGSIL